MYLSYLLINTGVDPDRPRPGRLWLRNVYRVHQRLCMAFPTNARKEEDSLFIKPFKPTDFIYAHASDHKHDDVHGQRTSEQAFLFRIDPLPSGRAIIVVQSATRPDWEYAFKNAGFLLAAPPNGPKVFEPHFENGQICRFRLVANPTRKLDKENRPEGRKNYGKRLPVDRDKIEDWLESRADRAGFKIEHFLNVQTGYVGAFKGNDEKVKEEVKDDRLKRFFYARYDGELRVINPDLLRGAIIHGIGPAKGFGFGLLSIATLKS